MAKLNKSTPIEEPLRPKIITFEQGRRIERELPFVGPTEVVELPVLRIPQNLLPRGEFIGREKEKAQVQEALSSRSYLVSIDGIAGIGKTALALEVAHELWEEQSFEAVIWTTAKDRGLTLNDVLDTIARTLGYPYITQLPPEEKPSEAAKLLRAHKCLLIVDNFETITDDAVRDFLLNLPEPSKALITSREQKLRQARAISLRGMEQGEALALIRSEGRRLGLPAVETAEEKVLLRLYEATGGAPLAIKWAVGQIKQWARSLDGVLDSLYSARADIFEFLFGRSWELLSNDAKRILMVMPIFATSASKTAIEAASDVHNWDLSEGLGQLAEMWLIEASEELDEAKRRYSIHPLTRSFIRARLAEEVDFNREARLRAANYFLNFAQRHGGTDWEDWSGYNMLEIERENILAIIAWCYDTSQWKMVLKLVDAIKDFLYIYGYWDEYIEQSRKALEAAKQEDDKGSEARFLKSIGWILCWQGNYVKAQSLLEEALKIARAIKDKGRGADVIGRLGVLAYCREDYDRAKQFLEEALSINLAINDKRDAVIDRYWLGVLMYDQDKYKQAQQIFEQTLAQAKEIKWQRVVAYALNYLGDIAREQHRYEEAQRLYEAGLESVQGFQDRLRIAYLKRSQALLEDKLGNFATALRMATEANEDFQRLGMRKEIEETGELVGRLETRITETRK